MRGTRLSLGLQQRRFGQLHGLLRVPDFLGGNGMQRQQWLALGQVDFGARQIEASRFDHRIVLSRRQLLLAYLAHRLRQGA